MSLLLALTAAEPAPAVRRQVGGGGGRRWKRYEPPKEEEQRPIEFAVVTERDVQALLAQVEEQQFALSFEAAYKRALNRPSGPSQTIRAKLAPRTQQEKDIEEMDIVFLASLDL